MIKSSILYLYLPLQYYPESNKTKFQTPVTGKDTELVRGISVGDRPASTLLCTCSWSYWSQKLAVRVCTFLLRYITFCYILELYIRVKLYACLISFACLGAPRWQAKNSFLQFSNSLLFSHIYWIFFVDAVLRLREQSWMWRDDILFGDTKYLQCNWPRPLRGEETKYVCEKTPESFWKDFLRKCDG